MKKKKIDTRKEKYRESERARDERKNFEWISLQDAWMPIMCKYVQYEMRIRMPGSKSGSPFFLLQIVRIRRHMIVFFTFSIFCSGGFSFILSPPHMRLIFSLYTAFLCIFLLSSFLPFVNFSIRLYFSRFPAAAIPFKTFFWPRFRIRIL